MLEIEVKKPRVMLAGRTYALKFAVKNVCNKDFQGGELEYVITKHIPIRLEYTWFKLKVPPLKKGESAEIEEFYYPISSGDHIIKIRSKGPHICLLSRQIKGRIRPVAAIAGGELIIPFKVYSWSEIVKLIGAVSATVGMVISVLTLVLN